jgi:hypothetical protein
MATRTPTFQAERLGTRPRVQARRGGVVRAALLGLGAYLAGLSILMLISPSTFHSTLGPFGALNDHYTRDAATFQLSLGVLALVAAQRPSWRLPALLVLTMQFGLHALNHLADITEADPRWVGPADLVGLIAATVVLGWLLVRLRREEPPQ